MLSARIKQALAAALIAATLLVAGAAPYIMPGGRNVTQSASR